MDEIFASQRRKLYRTALRIVGSPAQAEDVVHDAYVHIAEMANLLEVKQPDAYLQRVVRNLAVDSSRRAWLEKNLFEAEDAGLAVPQPGAAPDRIAISRKNLFIVDAALNALPPRTRRAFLMHRVHGCTQKEVATELGVSPTLVNFMIRDACAALAGCRADLLSD